MITCPKCSKENQDHYKFCLGCGAELPRDAAPKAFSPQTPPHGMRAAAPAAAPWRLLRRRLHCSSAPRCSASAVRGPSSRLHRVRRARSRPRASRSARAAVQWRARSAATSTRRATSSAPRAATTWRSWLRRRARTRARRRAPQLLRRASLAAGDAHRASRRRQRSGHLRSPGTAMTVGRDIGGIFAGDSYLSPRHATFSARGAQDLRQGRGLAQRRLHEARPRSSPSSCTPATCSASARRSSGSSCLRRRHRPPTASSGSAARPRATSGVCRSSSAATRPAMRIRCPRHGIHIGRERGDVLFPEDGYVSGLHCRISVGQRPTPSHRPRKLERHVRSASTQSDEVQDRRRAAHGPAALPHQASEAARGMQFIMAARDHPRRRGGRSQRRALPHHPAPPHRGAAADVGVPRRARRGGRDRRRRAEARGLASPRGQIDVGKLISFVSHPYEHYVVDLYLYECRVVSGELRGAAT